MVWRAAAAAVMLWAGSARADGPGFQLVVATAWNGNQGYLAQLSGVDPIEVGVVVIGGGFWSNQTASAIVQDGGTGAIIFQVPDSGPYDISVMGIDPGAALHMPITKQGVYVTQSPWFWMGNWAQNPNWRALDWRTMFRRAKMDWDVR